MSEEWPDGWYRDEQGRPAQPGFTPRQDAHGSPYEPTQAGPHGTAWPAQPPARSRPGDGGPPRTRGPRGRRTAADARAAGPAAVAAAEAHPDHPGGPVEWNVPEAKVFFNDLAPTSRCPRTSSPAPPSPGPRSHHRVTARHAPGHDGYEFKTRAPMSVCVYICLHLHGIDALPTVFARFAAIRLSGPQPEVRWTLTRILDRAGVMASR
jgi:hypothetical protein